MSRRILKFKKRYVAVRAFPDNLNENRIYEEIKNTFRRMFGDIAVIKAHLSFVRVRRIQGIVILACNHLYLGKVIAAITLVNDIDGVDVALDVITVSGTLKTLKRKIAEMH